MTLRIIYCILVSIGSRPLVIFNHILFIYSVFCMGRYKQAMVFYFVVLHLTLNNNVFTPGIVNTVR